MENIGYWVPVDKENGSGQHAHLTSSGTRSRDAAKESWKAFGADPEWKKAQKASESRRQDSRQSAGVHFP